MKIKNKIETILKEINSEKIKLVAVTKTRTKEEIKEAIQSGIRIIAENRIQEAEKKYNDLKEYFKEKKVSFHFVGHLQSNKVKKAIMMFDIIQSIDSLKLAKEIDKRAKEINKVQEIFIEINIGEEKQKQGVISEDLPKLIKEIKKLKNINLTGIMCLPPHSENPEASRKYFKEMKYLLDKTNLKYLSMGMTNDYKIAIEEGSNMIRIGRGIFEY